MEPADEMTDAEARVALSLLSNMAQGGATEGDILLALARAGGANLIAFAERGGGTIHIKPERVAFVEERHTGSVIHFTPGGRNTPVWVEADRAEVLRALASST
jgi:hypothetical protein